jgi:CTP:molybdopterin cytidylyltransferase MocA
MVQIGGVLLAAGEGSRLGGPKALVELAGARLVERGVALLRAGGTAPLVVVTGAVDVALPGVTTVHNPDWRSGMGSSLAAGLAALPASCEAAVVALVDQPLVTPAVVQRLVAAYLAGAGLAVARYGGPPYLRAHPELVTAVECGDIGRPDDIDTPADLARVSAVLAAAGSGPGGGEPGAS